MLIYDTEQEARIREVLREKYRLICPNHDIGHLKVFKNYFNIIGWADAVVVAEYEGFVTKGVYAEVLYALKNELPVWVIRDTSEGFFFDRVERIEYQSERANRHHYGKLITRGNGSII
jgi:hypothetical protein